MVATLQDSIVTPKSPTPFDGAGWGQLVTRDQVGHHNPIPDPTKSHRPLPHHEVMDYFTATMDRMGFVLSEPTLYLSKDDYRSNFFAGFGIAHKDLPADPSFQWQSFLINSHNKKHSLQIGAGHETFVCSNGMVLAPLGLFRTKHTKYVNNIDESGLPRWKNRITRMCENIENECRRYLNLTQSLQGVGLDAESRSHRQAVQSLCLESAVRGIVNPAGAVSVYKHWDNPEHKEFTEDQTVWRLMQAFTSHDRGKSAFTRRDRNGMMFDLFSERFGTLKADGTTPVRSFDTPVVVQASNGGDF